MMKAVGFEREFAKTFENLTALCYEKNRLKNRMGGQHRRHAFKKSDRWQPALFQVA